MAETAFDPKACEVTLFGALLDQAARTGADRLALEDVERTPLTYKRLILGSLVLGDKLTAGTRHADVVGVLLPNVNAMVVTLMGLNAFGRVAALLNFTAGARNLVSALRTGLIGRVVTSRRFVEQAKLEDVVKALADTEAEPGRKVEIVYLEDVRKAIGALDKVKGLARSLHAKGFHAARCLKPGEPAVLLFTSGTEGAPKGVALSSRNLVANARQIYAHADGALKPTDVMMNPLPMFHSYGLTAGTLMPLLHGLKVVLYPSPLHYKAVPKLVRETATTVMVATDTFLQGYGRSAEPDDFKTVRFVVAGAERVKDATRALYARTGTLILEGYGCTECSPVLACNLPQADKPGTVGRMLPGIEHRLVPVEGITEGGRLMVRGPNVMLGYIAADHPGEIAPPDDGWHDTGDIVSLDGEGYVTIGGRAKRFAKIGGEMISLAAVEGLVAGLWPDHNHVVVSIPDPKRGESLVLVTSRPGADRADIVRHAQEAGLPELWVPRSIMEVGEIPVLGTGKVDYPATLDLARRQAAAA